jgi:creatinine amidohydrolase
MIRPYILSEINWKTVKNQKTELAVLPWGATEAHNYHLPYGTDVIETELMAAESARLAWEKGASVIVLPIIPFGVNTGQKNIPLTINMNPSTQLMVLKDIADSLNGQGIKKLLILNGHGGNDFKQLVRETGACFPEMFISVCNWFQAVERTGIFENEGDHADEAETSLMLYLANDLVLPLEEAGEGKNKNFSINALNEKWAWAERKWTEVTSDTGIGNPKKATSEKGEIFFNKICMKMSELMYDLAMAKGRH